MASFATLCALLTLGNILVTAQPLVTIRQSQTQHISYRGSTANSVEHFQNIRYAHDTSGARRFAPPEPYTPPWGTEIDASAPGPACPQNRDEIPLAFAETRYISEDCLNLRISRPVGTKADDKLPVVVWLHGGGAVRGSAYDPHFDPDSMLELSRTLGKSVIYVALNYRLGIFGFARLPSLQKQQSMNVGMRDATSWISVDKRQH